MRRFAAIVITFLTLSSRAGAQAQNPIEVGLDGALATSFESPRVTSVSIPIQRLRVGFFTSPRVSIEPYGALNYGRVESSTFTSVNFGVGGLFHFGAARSAPQPYVRPFVELEHNSTSSDVGVGGTTAFALGGGVGVKIPVSNRFAWRFEAALAHAFEHDRNNASTTLFGFFGVSVFLH